MNELCHDGRSSNVRLAQKLGISAVTVAKKINTMIEKGVIAIKAMPNPARMGYQAQAFIGLYVDLEKVESVCEQLTKNPHVNSIVTSFGRFNVVLIVFFHEWGMLQDFIKEELPRIEAINHIETYLIAEDRQRNDRIFLSNFTESKPTLIDEVDQKLIGELMRNGRPDYTELANRLGISTSTVSRRIASLLKESIIKILAIPNPSKLGYSANAYIFVRAELAKVPKIYDQLCGYSELHMVMRLMNDFDIMFGVYAANIDTLQELLKSKIANIDGILNIETFIRGNFYYFNTDALFPPSVGHSTKMRTSLHKR
jgi:Lrp/AsnC family transcriptional regulator for asnA, asnC and gidA